MEEFPSHMSDDADGLYGVFYEANWNNSNPYLGTGSSQIGKDTCKRENGSKSEDVLSQIRWGKKNQESKGARKRDAFRGKGT